MRALDAFAPAPPGLGARARRAMRSPLCVRRRARFRAAVDGPATPATPPAEGPGAGQGDGESAYKGPRFDPNSDLNAFGRDPKKETEFWLGSAKEVLDLPEVRNAIEEHGKDPGSGVDPEREAYLEFIRSLDEGKSSSE